MAGVAVLDEVLVGEEVSVLVGVAVGRGDVAVGVAVGKGDVAVGVGVSPCGEDSVKLTRVVA
jgi:hypothetical protein